MLESGNSNTLESDTSETGNWGYRPALQADQIVEEGTVACRTELSRMNGGAYGEALGHNGRNRRICATTRRCQVGCIYPTSYTCRCHRERVRHDLVHFVLV